MSKHGEAPIAPEHDLNLLAAFLEQRLEANERDAVVQHLAGCAECREVVATLTREEIADRRAETRPGLRTADRRAEARPGLRTDKRPGLRTAVWLPIAASIALVAGAGWLARDRFWTAPPDAPVTTAPPPAPGPAPGGSGAVTPAPPKPPVSDPGTTRRSAAERDVAGRRFTLEAGTWIDTGFDPFALLPAVDVRTAAERDALLARVPTLKPFLDLGPKVTVVHNGTVYRFDLPR